LPIVSAFAYHPEVRDRCFRLLLACWVLGALLAPGVATASIAFHLALHHDHDEEASEEKPHGEGPVHEHRLAAPPHDHPVRPSSWTEPNGESRTRRPLAAVKPAQPFDLGSIDPIPPKGFVRRQNLDPRPTLPLGSSVILRI
jgi:hypothetical protein